MEIVATVPRTVSGSITTNDLSQRNSTIVITNETPAIPETVEDGVYRFFNTQTGTHFYTAAEAEKDSIIANLPTFNFEGTAYWVDPVMG